LPGMALRAKTPNPRPTPIEAGEDAELQSLHKFFRELKQRILHPSFPGFPIHVPDGSLPGNGTLSENFNPASI